VTQPVFRCPEDIGGAGDNAKQPRRCAKRYRRCSNGRHASLLVIPRPARRFALNAERIRALAICTGGVVGDLNR
jgi:hypothetical protein